MTTDTPTGSADEVLDTAATQLRAAIDSFDSGLHHEALSQLVVAEQTLDAAAAAVTASPAADTLLVGIWRTRGEVSSDLGDHAIAITWLERALDRAQTTDAITRIDTVGVLNALGMACKYSGRYEQSASAYEQALRILAEIDLSEGDDGPEGIDEPGLDSVRAVLLHNVGGNAHAQGSFELAEIATREALELHRELDGDGSYSVASDRAALAAILHATGRSDEAEPLLRAAIEVLEATVGRCHRDTASAWHNLGDALAARNAYDESRAAYDQAVSLRRELFGATHPDLAMSLNNLAVLEASCGRPEAARTHLEEAAKIVISTLDPAHPLALSVDRNAAAVAEMLGD